MNKIIELLNASMVRYVGPWNELVRQATEEIERLDAKLIQSAQISNDEFNTASAVAHAQQDEARRWQARVIKAERRLVEIDKENLSIQALLDEIKLLKLLLREAYPSVLADAEQDHDHYESKEMLRDLAKRINDQVAQ